MESSPEPKRIQEAFDDPERIRRGIERYHREHPDEPTPIEQLSIWSEVPDEEIEHLQSQVDKLIERGKPMASITFNGLRLRDPNNPEMGWTQDEP